jgi:hypothetical protein
MRGDRFTDDEWARLLPAAEHNGLSRPKLVRECVLYLIGERANFPKRPEDTDDPRP